MYCLFQQRSLKPRGFIDYAHPKIAQPGNPFLVQSVDPLQRAKAVAGNPGFTFALAFVTAQLFLRDRARPITDQSCEYFDITETEVNPLPGEWMDTMRSISDQHYPVFNPVLTVMPTVRKTQAIAAGTYPAELELEGFAKRVAKLVIGGIGELSRKLIITGPDYRALSIGQR